MKFQELSDKAKAHAREVFINSYFDDDSWYEPVIDDFIMDMKNRYNVELDRDGIQFSVAYSQSDFAEIKVPAELPKEFVIKYIDMMADAAELQNKQTIYKAFEESIPYINFETIIQNAGNAELNGDWTELQYDLSNLFDDGKITEASYDMVYDKVAEVGQVMNEELGEKFQGFAKMLYKRLQDEIEWFWEDDNVDNLLIENDEEYDEDGDIV